MGLFDSISLNENEGGRLLKRASVVAKARYDARFASFIDSASSAEERKQRFEMVSDGIRELAEIVASEQGVDANTVFNKIAVDILGESPNDLDAPDLQGDLDDDDLEDKKRQIAQILGIDPSQVDMAALKAAIGDFDSENPIPDEDKADAKLDIPEKTLPPQEQYGSGQYIARRSDAVQDSVFSVLAAEFGDTSTMERVDVSTGDGPIPEINLSPVGDGLSPIEVPSVANPTEQIGVTDEIVAENAADDIVPTTQTERVDIENAPAEQTGDGTSVFPAGNQAQPVTSRKKRAEFVGGDYGLPHDNYNVDWDSPATTIDTDFETKFWKEHLKDFDDPEEALRYLQMIVDHQNHPDSGNDPDPTGSGEAFGDNRNFPEGTVKNYTSKWKVANEPDGHGWMNLFPQNGQPTFEWDKRPPQADAYGGKVDEDHYELATQMRDNPALYVADLFQAGHTYEGVVNYLVDFLGYDEPEAERLVAQYAPDDEKANRTASYGDYAPSGGWDHQPSVHDRAVELARKGMTADEIRQRLREEFDEDPDEIDYAVGAALRANEPRPMESDPRY